MVYHISSVHVTNPAGPTEEDEGHGEHLLMKMNFLKLEHKRAETAKRSVWLESLRKRGGRTREAPWTLISVRGRYNFMPI